MITIKEIGSLNLRQAILRLTFTRSSKGGSWVMLRLGFCGPKRRSVLLLAPPVILRGFFLASESCAATDKQAQSSMSVAKSDRDNIRFIIQKRWLIPIWIKNGTYRKTEIGIFTSIIPFQFARKVIYNQAIRNEISPISNLLLAFLARGKASKNSILLKSRAVSTDQTRPRGLAAHFLPLFESREI
jgi:hypothetical protein